MKRSDDSSNLNITSYPGSRYRSIITSRSSSDSTDNKMGSENVSGSSIPPYLASTSGSTSMSERFSDSKEHQMRNENNSSLIPSPPETTGRYMSLFGVMIPATPTEDLCFEQTKKMKFSEEVEVSPLYRRYLEADYRHGTAINFNDPFAVSKWMDELNSAKFGSVTNEIDDVRARTTEAMKPYFKRHPTLTHGPMDWTLPRNASTANKPPNVMENPHANSMLNQRFNFPANQGINVMANQPVSVTTNQPVNFARDMVVFNGNSGLDMNTVQPVVIINSDDEESGRQRPFQPYEEIVLKKPAGVFLMKQFFEGDNSQDQTVMGADANIAAEPKSRKGKRVHESAEEKIPKDKSVCKSVKEERPKDKGVYVGVEDDTESEESNGHLDPNFDGLADIWQEMTVALECSKDTSTSAQPSSNETTKDSGEECEHSFILKDDLGYVCRICGVIGRGIETIIEFQQPKGTKNTRTSWYEGRTSKDKEAAQVNLDGMRGAQDFSVSEINAHPRHRKQMKPHQVEGFNFLVSNLVTDNPGGCILAHAPGSGKTFMLISFIQSFMAKYPLARPLVVLPRGILPTWKKEVKRWQIEDIPLFDFYSVKAESRSQQLEVLKQWVQERSILFLGYKQFSAIVCDNDMGVTSSTCQEILLTYPSILILDEGHTPRNQDTDVLTSLEKVQTPRKVVLSGTLYQNHVKEVFNILNLVRPKFLRLETSKAIKKRILSRVPISSRRNVLKKGTDNEFYDLVEHTLVKDENFKRKVMVIEDLREMTSKVLHYYKGDFLDELPGLVDFSVFLNLCHKQKQEVTELRKLSRKFKITSDGSAIYVHPELKSLATNTTAKDRVDDVKIDSLLEKINEREGVKAKFFLNLLRLCESSGEKMIVFGQYLLPLKFLERLTMKVKGWSPGKEIFMITGDSDSDFRELSMDRFNNSPDAKVFFGSIKACGEGISLVGASRIIILDVHLNPSVTRQAIGRAFRPGQVKKVYTYRLVAADSPEAEDHATCFKKESISKMWFEWNEFCGHHDFEMETAVITDCGDQFLETPFLNEDIAALYKR